MNRDLLYQPVDELHYFKMHMSLMALLPAIIFYIYRISIFGGKHMILYWCGLIFGAITLIILSNIYLCLIALLEVYLLMPFYSQSISFYSR
jgi:hypothetical protein